MEPKKFDEQVWDILFENVRTLEEAYRLDDELRVVQQQSFIVLAGDDKKSTRKTRSPKSLAEKSKALVSHSTYQKISELEAKQYISFSDQDTLRNFFEFAHRKIMETPRLQLQLAYEVNAQVLGTLYAWVKRELKSRVFLDIVVKPQILAGCIIVYQGVFRDYSLRTVLKTRAREIFKPIMEDISHRSRPN